MTRTGTAIHNNPFRPMVSVVIPFLNPGAFFEEAIRSVIAQTHSDWELLLVNDGATDGSPDIARRYTDRHPERIFYLAHPGQRNCGASASRNLGLRKARGAYVAFLDADDVWMPNKLERQLQLIDAHPEVAMTYGPALTWYSWTDKASDQGRDFVLDTGVPTPLVVSPPMLVEMYLRINGMDTIPTTSGVLVRKQCALAVGGFVDEFRWACHDDLVFFAKLALRESILVVDEGHYSYRQHTASGVATAMRTDLERKIWVQFLTWLREYMAENGIASVTVEKLIADELRRVAAAKFRASLRGIARIALPAGLRRWLRSQAASS